MNTMLFKNKTTFNNNFLILSFIILNVILVIFAMLSCISYEILFYEQRHISSDFYARIVVKSLFLSIFLYLSFLVSYSIGILNAKTSIYWKIFIFLIFYYSMGLSTGIIGIPVNPIILLEYLQVSLYTPIRGLPITITAFAGFCLGICAVKLEKKRKIKSFIIIFIYSIIFISIFQYVMFDPPK